ncbi:hypothetical protein SAMN04490186_2006 [Pseudomonas grimontii]|jgi:hypothetical protein|uniref:Uncharacterized protein n=1 Tax=Pseudomonas grimontii TaxID=129847 RepID=A0ABY0TGP1_9PSED|nr:hypothetical protein [Pseudomonas grimontii]SDQ80105.1 hypothetical protein SAMN04490186_2006 [Pseudomonas grimontii]
MIAGCMASLEGTQAAVAVLGKSNLEENTTYAFFP